MQTLVERRTSPRTPLKWPVSMWIPAAKRFLYGHSSNISKSGALIEAPATSPVRLGQTIEINFPRTENLAREKGSFGRLKTGTVVRLDRPGVTNGASMAVAVRFT